MTTMVGGTNDTFASIDANDAEGWLRSVAESIASATDGLSVVACVYRRVAGARIEMHEHLTIERERRCESPERHVVFLRAFASDDEGCMLCVVREGPRRDDDDVAREMLRRVEAHLALVYRRRLAARDPGADAQRASRAETPRDDSRLASLARFALGDGRRLDAIDSAALRRTLLTRAWSVLDGYFRDGRLFVVARIETTSERDLVPLTEREREVVSRVAIGRANKCIAYELGIETSTVAQLLRRALTRLGLFDRAERAAFLGDVHERLAAVG